MSLGASDQGDIMSEFSEDLPTLLAQIKMHKHVLGSVMVEPGGRQIVQNLRPDVDAEYVGAWALGVYINSKQMTNKIGHKKVHQVVLRTTRGYVIIVDFGSGLIATVVDDTHISTLIPVMRTITKLVCETV